MIQLFIPILFKAKIVIKYIFDESFESKLDFTGPLSNTIEIHFHSFLKNTDHSIAIQVSGELLLQLLIMSKLNVLF